MISRSGTRKSSDANMLAVKQGFDFAQRSTGLSEVFRLPLRKMPVYRKSSDFRYERCRFIGSLPTSATKDAGLSEVFRRPLRKMPVYRKSSDFRYERWEFKMVLPTMLLHSGVFLLVLPLRLMNPFR